MFQSKHRSSFARVLISCIVSMVIVAGGIIAVVVTGPADAATYTSSTFGPANWTAAASWRCTAGAPGSTACGNYPGDPDAGGVGLGANGDVATVTGGTYTVDSTIANAVTLNHSFGTVVVNTSSAGVTGALKLQGASSVSSSASLQVGSSFVNLGNLAVAAGSTLTFVNGAGANMVFTQGTINNAGQIVFDGTTSAGPTSFTWNGGTINGGGLLIISNAADAIKASATLSGTSAMNLDNSTIANNGNVTFGNTNTLTFLNNALFSNNASGRFTATNSAQIQGGIAGGRFNNAGVYEKNSGPQSIINVPFDSAGTVSITSTSGPVSVDFSSGGALSGPFNLGLTSGSSFLFAGTAAKPIDFNAGASFSGAAGDITFHGSRQNVNTTLSLPGNFLNNGNTFFGSGTPQTINVAGNFSQATAPSGSIDARLFNATTYDKVTVTGTAGLSGNFNESVLYSPANGDTFQPITFSNNSGTTFQSVIAMNPNGVFTVSYPPTVAAATAMQLAAVSQADIQVGKSGPGTVMNGQNATWNLAIGNTGPSPAGPVVLTESFTNATFVSSTPPICSGPAAGPLTCTIPTLGVGVTQPVAIVLKANGVGTIVNTLSVSSTTPIDPNSSNDSVTTRTTVTAASDLGITIAGPLTGIGGSTITYSATINNAGPDPVTPAATFTLTNGTLTAATSPAFTCTVTSPTAASCTATAPFASTASGVITLTTTAPATGTMTITGSVTPTASDPNTADNTNSASTTISAATADVGVSKTLTTASPIAGQNVSFSVVVTNSGPATASNVAVTDAASANLTFVSNTGACTTGFPCTIPSIPAGGNVSFTSTFALAPGAGGQTFTNSVTGTESTDTNSANNTGTASGVAGINSDLAINKSGPSSAGPGQSVTYTINVINNGPSTATGVTVNDPTPAGTTPGPVTSTFCSSFPCNIGNLLPGAGATINATFTISPAQTAPVNNTATVTSSSADGNLGNNSSTVTTTVVPKADLSIVKTGPATLPVSGPVTFNIVVKNNGPSTANNLFVNDSPGPGLSFVSNSGGCSTPFPCSFATLASGASITIQSKFNVSSTVSSVTNTADVNASTADPNNSNNSSTVTLFRGNTCPNGTLTQFQPFSGQTDAPTSGVMQWTNLGASTYEVYLGPAGSGCSTLVATVNGTSYNYTGLTPNSDYESRIVAVQSGCPSIASQCIRWRTASGGCNLTAPLLQSPAAGTTVGGSTTLKWSAVPGATSYHVVVVVNGVTQVDTTTPDTSLDVTIPNGNATWSVTAISGNCTGPAANGAFGVCGAPQAPLAGVVGAPTSGNTYSVIVVVPSPGAVSYDFQEATDASFGGAITQNSNSTAMSYSHTTNVPQVFFYRVRAIGACTNTPGPFSKPLRVVIVPAVQDLRNPKVNVPAGNKNLVVVQVFVPGDSVQENFVATSDRPWVVRIDPSSGILPPEGITLNVTIDPSQLPNGTFTATVLVSTSPVNGSSRLVTNGSNKSVPVSINLVTPVVPVNPNAPTADSIFIPAVGHLAGLNSQWRSDIRIYNASPQTLQYLLNFTPQGSTDVKQTTITTLSGDTTALDDIIHNWFGVGEVGDSSTGVLEIRPMTTDGSTTPPKGSAFTTVASSRTFNATSDGTVGQFIPPVAFSNFIGNGSRLSMQQLAQSQAYRTNFGLLEGSGAPVSLVLSMFNSAGTKLFDLPVDLAAGEQKLLNGLLAEKGVTVSDGRMEVKVAGGDGKVTAYASVIDNASLDPQLVPGENLTGTTSKLYVVPGVADLNNGVASWRTDMRIYNSGNAPQSTDLAFYPQDKAGAPFFATLTVNPNEVKVLDSVVQSLFGTHDVGGMVQLTTPADSQLVVTARTYNQTANGTLGQFIKAATAAEGITTSTKALNILQVEDSPRFRTNVGLAEMTGKPVTVEVSVILPDSKVTPSIQVPMAANEFRQFGVAQFGLGNVYNARVSVKVIDGSGSVTAYGSVIDQVTTDPTYVRAQ